MESDNAIPDSDSEIELYGELLAFAVLSPDQQQAQSDCLASSAISAGTSPAVESLPQSASLNAKEEEGEASAPSGPLHITGPLSAAYALPEGDASAATATCSACGSRSHAHDLFCIACGHFLDEGDLN
jgi:hypothetical protein